MLDTLWIENFLTISRLEIDFKQGFTALTGETGAGKSILMDALLLVLGQRADISMIRPQAESCEISATFQVSIESAAYKWAQEEGLALSEGEWILTRQLHQTGRTKTYINGKPAPLQLLKNLGSQLVHVHGQHAHYALLQGHTARVHVDRYGEHQDLLKRVNAAYETCQGLKQQLKALGETQEGLQRLAYLEFQKKELEELKLEENEIEQLTVEHKRLHHLKDYLQLGQQLLSRLGSEEQGLAFQLHEAQSILRQLPANEPQIGSIKNLLEEAAIQIKEAEDEAQAWFESLISDPERLTFIEARMGELHQVARKFRVEVNALLAMQDKLSVEYEQLEAQLNQHPLLMEKLHAAEKNYQDAAELLRQARKKISPILSQGISQHMKDLGMAHGVMQISFEENETPERHGLDKLNYEVSTNPGMPPSLLSKVASGGELSRISLAIELMTAQRAGTPTLIFDEVDVGIGGNTAYVVGRLMRQLGERAQVFCVTHQPQVAACAHQHLKVEKNVLDAQTFTAARLLPKPERIEELARMLGGAAITEEALRHAEVLLED